MLIDLFERIENVFRRLETYIEVPPTAGMTDAMLAEVLAVVGMANETNRLASGYQVEIDERFLNVSGVS